jgi:predicted regulator of Ras-like GTPase activity (Roadblock/LC7/MglB family)
VLVVVAETSVNVGLIRVELLKSVDRLTAAGEAGAA